MPPTGNHPVRAATSASTSDPRSGGIDTASIETVPIRARSGPGARLPATIPSHRTGHRRHSQRRKREDDRILRVRSPSNALTGRP